MRRVAAGGNERRSVVRRIDQRAYDAHGTGIECLADIAHEAGLPPGVMNIVQGIGEDAGAALTTRMDIDRISFTGSTGTARIIGEAAARSLTPVGFELGGKSPFIVCADADLEAAAQTVAGQYTNAGQICLAGTRLYVEASIAERFLAMVKAATANTVVGDPRNPATRVGPLIHPEHAARVAGFVERAKADGIEVLWVAHRIRKGRSTISRRCWPVCAATRRFISRKSLARC